MKQKSLPLLLAFAAAIVILACGESANAGSAVNNGSSSGNSSNSSTNTPAVAQHFKVGTQVKVGDTWIITINSAKANSGTDFDQPKAGDTYLVIDASFKNVSSQEQDLSTLLQLTLKDNTGQKYDETVVSFGTSPDGKVEANDTNRGQVVYEIPTSQHQFTLSFVADITSEGQTTWDLSI